MIWARDDGDRDAESWYLTHNRDVYSLHRRYDDPLTITVMKNGFFLDRFVGRGMALAKEYTEIHLVDAPPPEDAA